MKLIKVFRLVVPFVLASALTLGVAGCASFESKDGDPHAEMTCPICQKMHKEQGHAGQGACEKCHEAHARGHS